MVVRLVHGRERKEGFFKILYDLKKKKNNNNKKKKNISMHCKSHIQPVQQYINLTELVLFELTLVMLNELRCHAHF